MMSGILAECARWSPDVVISRREAHIQSEPQDDSHMGTILGINLRGSKNNGKLINVFQSTHSLSF